MLVHVARLHFHGMYWRSVVTPFHFAGWLQLPCVNSALTHPPHVPCAVGRRPRARHVAAAVRFGIRNGVHVLCALRAHDVQQPFLFICHFRGAPRAHRRPEPSCVHAVLVAARVLRAQLALVYAYAAVAKLNENWLVHGEPMATKLASRRVARAGMRWTLDAACAPFSCRGQASPSMGSHRLATATERGQSASRSRARSTSATPHSGGSATSRG